jgi:hypothetical protein
MTNEKVTSGFTDETTVEVLSLALAEDPETEAEPEEKAAPAISYQRSIGRSMRANA